FQECEGPAVFFISLKAGGVGINLSAADYVYLYDPWWNQALEAQAIDRAHRIGRRDTVVAKRLIARETVEEKILQLNARKSQLAEGVLGADFSDTSLSIEDLEFLLA
ncbi:MAG: SWF/SNF helicase family protein, partial [Chlamydiia bacterium]|nr:SWF/SNF helicase family protein [Chlamydiia bacterium]